MGKKNPNQPSLFPLGEDENKQIETLNRHYSSVNKPYVSLRAEPGNARLGVDDDRQTLYLPRRWEFCVEKARELNVFSSLLSTVRPPARALDELAAYIDLLKSSAGEGALWIFYGNSGSGKTTFLQTLEHHVNKEDQDILEVHVIKGEQIDLTSRLSAYQIFRERIEARKNSATVLVLVLEDIEQSLTDGELEGLSQALKMVLRSPQRAFSKNVLVVIPVNNQKHGMRIQDAVNEIGLLFRENRENTLYIFEGPKEEQYIEIVEDLTSVLNGRPLGDFGIRRDTLEKIPKRRTTIGNFIQNVLELTNSQEKRTVELLRENQYKKLVTIYVFVRPMHPTELYNASQLVVADRFNRLSSEWLLSESGAEGNNWKARPEKLAAIINNILHVRVVEFPPHILYQMIQMCSDNALQTSLKGHLEKENLNPTKPHNWTNVHEAIFSTNLMRLLRGEQTKRPSHVGLEADEEEGGETPQRRELLHKGIATAKWATSQNQYDLNGTIALGFKQVLTSGPRNIEGFQGIWAETVLGIEKSSGVIEKTVRPDITVETPDTLYLIEMNYEKKEVLTRNDIARYIMKKINSYCKQIPILRQFESLS